MSFLKDLYDGEIRPCEEIPHTDEFKAAQSALSKAAKELDEALTAEQKELFCTYKERFFDCVPFNKFMIILTSEKSFVNAEGPVFSILP